MTNINMQLWESVFITDPSRTKPITGKPYKGTSPNPYWLVQRATEVFGPCGQGWWIEIKNQGYQPMGPETMMHWVHIRFNYLKDDKVCWCEHMGGTQAMYKTNNGKMVFDEDAPKKSVTDALVKCMSYLGFCGDIFSGLWDDWKYQQFAAEHYQQQGQAQQQQQPAQQQSQQKPLKERFNDALASIPKMRNPKTLNKVIATYKDTEYYQTIVNACRARADQMGWEFKG